ncbi:MAG: acetyl-CoA carboxylase biotin carboxyl carrier protein subunit [Cyclobacteriaceae bacterium]|nr:acetyl-CoA carboxylase biotin carboxyl carrier protein subunit [Cyclobacteriaceae bacterium]
MFKAAVRNNSYQISIDKGEFSIEGQKIDLDLAKLNNHKYHVISNNISYNIELVSLDKAKKLVILKVNNATYEVGLKDKMDELLAQLGMDLLLEAKTEDLKAPMPGLILEIAVEKGQSIAKGDKLLILEAMKMENVIKAASDAIVEDIKVNIGDSVDNGQILITFG